jgi:hypothetical protein
MYLSITLCTGELLENGLYLFLSYFPSMHVVLSKFPLLDRFLPIIVVREEGDTGGGDGDGDAAGDGAGFGEGADEEEGYQCDDEPEGLHNHYPGIGGGGGGGGGEEARYAPRTFSTASGRSDTTAGSSRSKHRNTHRSESTGAGTAATAGTGATGATGATGGTAGGGATTSARVLLKTKSQLFLTPQGSAHDQEALAAASCFIDMNPSMSFTGHETPENSDRLYALGVGGVGGMGGELSRSQSARNVHSSKSVKKSSTRLRPHTDSQDTSASVASAASVDIEHGTPL